MPSQHKTHERLIRPATPEDLHFLRARPDPERMAKIRDGEIRSARTATATPRHWQPVNIDESHMR
jgi:hypothetical protein